MINQVQPGSAAVIAGGEGIKNPRLQGILRYWQEKRGDRPMPSLADIDPVEIPRLLPIVLLADILPSDERMRLLGTDATNAYGRETRGRRVGELDFGEFSPFWRQAFSLVRSTGKPALAVGSYRCGMELLDAELLLVPLSDNGDDMSHIMGGLLIRPAPCMVTAGDRIATGILAASNPIPQTAR